MKNNNEGNKIFGAIVFAFFIASLAGFIAREAVKPQPAKNKGYVVEGMSTAQETTTKDAAVEAPPPPPIAPLLAKADIAAGQKSARVCLVCHSFEKGGANKVGPNLYGVVGAKPAAHAGFAYSAALQGISDKPWSEENMNLWLLNPRAYAAGNRMAFAGLKDPQERANIIAWMKSQ